MSKEAMKRFLIETSIENAEGSQTWYVDATSEAEALKKYEQGGCDLYASNVDVTSLGEPEISGETTLDDFGDFAEQPAQRPIKTFHDGKAWPVQEQAQQDSTCNNALRIQGKAYPRTCKKCGLGPCISESVKPAQQEPIDQLIHAWQALEETSDRVPDEGNVEGRMHMSVIRSAWKQMDSLVRDLWDERGRP